ncbi:MAG: REP-associated tyrosine transposase [Thermoleophilaceae bacterium]|jgi:REP element-mobilizing transposase RayT|nr:REP-associated tyrosine transposase [Thermoleophilaceae bacterium]
MGMAHLRVQYAGGIFHVWARRVDRSSLFVDEADYERYLTVLDRTVVACDWVLLSFCLMPNHVHLLIELRKPNLDKGMQKLHSSYVKWFNARHDRKGRLFEHRYGSRPVQDEIYFVTVVEYIESNPVTAKLAATPERWRWSSRGLIAARGCPDWTRG